MEEIVAFVKNLFVDTPYLRELLLIVITVVITHYFDVFKIKKEQQSRFQETLGSKTADALIEVRELVHKTKSIEMFDIDNVHPEEANLFKNQVYYPAIMNDRETLGEMFEAVCDARGKYELYLDNLSAAYLYIFDRYIMALFLYIKEYSLQDKIDVLGLLLIVDISKWEKAFDKHLVRQINHPHYRMYSKHGRLWELSKWYVTWRYLKGSVLDKLIRNDLEGLPFDPKTVSFGSQNEDQREEIVVI